MKRTTPARSAQTIESLESRRLLAADPGSLLAQGFEPVQWEGRTVYARPEQWVARVDGLSGLARKQLARVNTALENSAGPGKVEAVRHLGKDGLLLLRSAEGIKFNAVRKALRDAAGLGLASVEPDFALWTEATTPNDTLYSGHQYGLHNTGQTGGVADADIDAPEAWDLARGSSSVVVGVIDSGIDYTHPDLAANVWRNPGEIAGNGIDDDANGYTDDIHGYDFINNDPNPMDDNGHGTHVAGTIAAAGNNGVGVTGTAWNTQVMALKFLAADGAGSLSAALAAINYATKMRSTYGVNVRVTNNSWGGGGYSSILHDAIARSATAGILFVAAAGNGGADAIGDNNDLYAEYPAGYSVDNVLSVAATDHNDRLASFSNYGATSVDLAAPGVNIASTYPGNQYVYLSGTSMATPHVSGVAALAWSYNPSATYQTVRSAILNGVDVVTSLAGKVATGGRLNAHKALLNMPAPLKAPVAPSALTAAAAGAAQINLTWTDGSTNEDGFRIYVSSDGANFIAAGTVASGVSSVAITGLEPGMTYHWRVRAYNAAGDSPDSNTASATTAPLVTVPLAPSGLTATTASSTRINLAWADRSDNETGFRVERRTGSGAWSPAADLAAGATSWSDTTLSASTTYSYRIVAYNSAGTSASSNEVSAATTAAQALTSTRDVGAVGAGGSAGYDPAAGVYTVKGSGADIFGYADEFRFAYTTLTGDGQIVARVNSFPASHFSAKAGVMIRETLAAGSKNAFIGVTPGNGVMFQRRTGTNGGTSSVKAAGITAPHWVKLVRSGGTITGYRSADGVNWTPVGSTTISMASTVHVGLAVTSHIDGTLATATFGNVSAGKIAAPVAQATSITGTTLATRPLLAPALNRGGFTSPAQGIEPSIFDSIKMPSGPEEHAPA